jgi:hypothetical protein
MAEYVACPSCGCKLLVADGAVGQPMRCFACQRSFVARPATPTPPRSAPISQPQGAPRNGEQASPPGSGPQPRAPEFSAVADAVQQPFCPGCGRPVRWDWRNCPHCGEEFLEEADERRLARGLLARQRRDALPHRGKLLVNLGNLCLALGLLAFCTAGITALGSVPLGLTVWVLAANDLTAMRAGEVDAQGWSDTQAARTAAISGVVLGLVFLMGWGLLWLRF